MRIGIFTAPGCGNCGRVRKTLRPMATSLADQGLE